MKNLFKPVVNKNLFKFYSKTPKELTGLELIHKYNSKGKISQAVEAYEDLKRTGHQFSLDEFNQIISSFAPKALMFSWFKNFKDYVDMYYEAGFYRAKERVDEAQNVYKDMIKAKVKPDIHTYNELMKIYLSSGPLKLDEVFILYNQLTKIMDPNITTYMNLLRACALTENVALAEEIYGWTIHKFKIKENKYIPTQVYNAMMDVYAEARNDRIYPFFEQMMTKKIPTDGMTFNALAKAAIFLDQKHKLVYLPELMRVEGVLQKELSKPVRAEIYEAMKNHSHYYKDNDTKPKAYYKDKERRDTILFEFRTSTHILTNKWGRDEDIHNYSFWRDAKPYLEKYTIDTSKVLTPKLDRMHSYEINDFSLDLPEEIKGPVLPK